MTSISPESYDAENPRSPAAWLTLDEGERIVLAERYHLHLKDNLPNLKLHAVMHVIVENHAAEEVCGVREALLRLQAEGLSRHEAIHAVGSVLSTHLYDLAKTGTSFNHTQYEADLTALTAVGWRKTFGEEP